MIRIIDSTMGMVDEYRPSKEQLLAFLECMRAIGIMDLEISAYTYRTLEKLPEGFRFYMKLDGFQKKLNYPGIYKFFITRSENEEQTICNVQINDIKEMIHLRGYSHLNHLRIVGLDDLFCHNFQGTIQEIKNIFPGKEVNFCPENTYGCATALAVEWMLAGGKEVTTSFASCGKRAATEEVYMAMNIVKRYKPNQSLEILVKAKEIFEDITKETIPVFKPIIGTRIFWVESGIHVDGILKNPANYEAYPPEKVGQKTEIVLGKHSGSSSIINQCVDLSLEKPNAEQITRLLETIRKISVEKRRNITQEEFLLLYQEVMTSE